MLTALLLGVGMVTVSPSTPPSPAVLATYEAANAKTGRDPDAHVRLALWCEAHGLSAGRAKHLALAVLNDPNHAAARGLLGFVAYQGCWKRPEAVTVQMGRDEAGARILADYHARRNGVGSDAGAHWDLALWCEQHGLADESRAHLTAVTRLDPARDAAWEQLGYVRHDGRWVPREQAAAAEAQAAARAKAEEVWAPRLRAWENSLQALPLARRTEATTPLAQVGDPAVVPPLIATLPKGTVEWQRVAIEVFDRFPIPDSAQALVSLAVEGKTKAVRRDAVAALKRWDLLEYAGMVVGKLQTPIVYEFEPVLDFGMDGRLTVDWGDVIEVRIYHTPDSMGPNPAFLGRQFYVPDVLGRPMVRLFTSKTIGQTFAFDGKRMRRYDIVSTKATDIPVGQMWEDRLRSLRAARARQEKDLKRLQQRSRAVLRSNEAVVAVLQEISGKPFRAEAVNSWQAWWSEEEGYRYDRPEANPKRVIQTDIAPRPYESARPQTSGVGVSFVPRASCFAQGTPVWTLTGRRPIELVEVGDRVLAEDPVSGTLSYQSVIVANHNRPDATLKVILNNGDRFVCTGIHRLWLSGKGWVKARDVKPGDLIRTVDGLVAISTIEPDATQPVFNLGLGGRHGLFVGQTGVLAHDDSPIRPTPVLFDDDAPVDSVAP
ncbi:MAG: Hint domain-containing protein [Isosphaeraceae bacterium]|nr:Hint domain-containing protein [Isosphaeraceae bacterium]